MRPRKIHERYLFSAKNGHSRMKEILINHRICYHVFLFAVKTYIYTYTYIYIYVCVIVIVLQNEPHTNFLFFLACRNVLGCSKKLFRMPIVL